MPRAKKVLLPSNPYPIIDRLGLRVVTHRNVTMLCDDGQYYTLPRDIIGEDGQTLIIFRPADDTYSIDGWEPWHAKPFGGAFGGRYPNIHGALNWVQCAMDVAAGKRKDFQGA